MKILLPLLVGMGLYFVPLLGDFHIESAVLMSLVGCFWAGIKACDNNQQSKEDFYSALTVLGYLFLVGTPLFLGALFNGCFSIHGLAFWLIFPPPSVFFGYAIGRLLTKWGLPYRKTTTIVILSGIGVGILLFEFYHYPQLYFYNHVWGGWAGPVYDETIAISGSAVFFRSITMFWIVLLWYVPSINKEQVSIWIVGLSTIALGLSYTQLAEMGIISPPSHIRAVLGGSHETEHFQLYYDQNYYSESEISLLAREHEFHLQQIKDRLELQQPDSSHKIESFLYANPWQKKRLVGAKFTSYVPVWLDRDQLHIAKQQTEGSLRHELVHVVAKQFGNTLINASRSIGLIEGLAVAIDGGSSATTTVDQIVAAEKPYPGPETLRESFGLWGFYSGRSGVNYITSGSFVRYLLEHYPAEDFKKAYRTGNVMKAYPENWRILVRKWHQHLDSIAVDSTDRHHARQIFSIPSLLEQVCPHVESDFASAWDDYQYYRTIRDTARALHSLDKALVESDSLPPIKTEWSYRHILAGKNAAVRQMASPKDSTFDLQLLYADAFAQSGQPERAQIHIEKADNFSVSDSGIQRKWALDTRKDKRQGQIYRRLTYERTFPDSTTFREALYRTKIRAVRASIEQEKWLLMFGYAEQLLDYPVRKVFFDDYLILIHHLNFYDKKMIAEQWIQKLSRISLRDRYRERLNREIEWQSFLKNKKME